MVVEENDSIDSVFTSDIPIPWGLARKVGRHAPWSDLGSPSLPNFVTIFHGSLSVDPRYWLQRASCTYSGPSVSGQAIPKGDNFRANRESVPPALHRINGDNHDVKRNQSANLPFSAIFRRADEIPAGSVAAGPLVSDVRNLAALLWGEKETGNAIEDLDVGTDTGEVIDQRREPIGSEGGRATYERPADAGAAMLPEPLSLRGDGTAPRRPQGPAVDEVPSKHASQIGITDRARPAPVVHKRIEGLAEPYAGTLEVWEGGQAVGCAPRRRLPQPADRGDERRPVRRPSHDGRRSLLVTAMQVRGAPRRPAPPWAHSCGTGLNEVGEATAPVDARNRGLPVRRPERDKVRSSWG